jgi:glutaconyl-CoA/methylmalonyl-CoA decarboxylase subunit delta
MIYNILLQTASSDKKAITELLREMDPYGIGMTAIGMGVVFLSLLLLYVAFFNLSKVIAFRASRKVKKAAATEAVVKQEEISGEVNAAIAMALYLYSQEVHDQEPAVLTINKVGRTYSPWSSKIYGIRQNPR